MSVVSAKIPRRRLGTRFWAAILLVFSSQLSLIFWLSDRSPALASKPASSPVLRLDTVKTGELLALEDPTLFVLPNPMGFSGEGWMKSPVQQFESRDWSESPRWLSLSLDQLGSDFNGFIRTNSAMPFRSLVLEPDLVAPSFSPLLPISIAPAVWIEGDLKARRLLSQLEVRPEVSTDLLTNSVVQLMVDSQGNTFSAVLRVSSGSKAMDNYALKIARGTRFESVEAVGPDAALNPRQELMLGMMVFQWETLTRTNPLTSTATP